MKSDIEPNLPSEPSPSKKRTWVRWLVRASALAGAVFALWPAIPGTSLPVLVPASSPFLAVGSLIATRTFHTVVWLGLAVGVIAVVRPRWFCRWICPVGLCADGATWLGRRLGRPPIRGPLWGQWIVWLTLGGALLGYPLLLWLDPLTIFAGALRSGGRSAGPGAWTPALVFVALLLLSVFWTNAWCGRVCPLGAFQDVLFVWAKYLRTHIPPKDRGLKEPAAGSTLSRRTVLGIAVGAVWAGVTMRLRTAASRPLRPPGARDEHQFPGVCTRCGNCRQACPSKIIEHDSGKNGLASLLTPVLTFEHDYCREDCVLCTKVCPSGALRSLAPADKMKAPIGLPRVDMGICLLRDDRECTACRRRCPYDAIRYVFSEEDYMTRPQIDPAKCPGCGACEAACPTTPRKAIVVFPI